MARKKVRKYIWMTMLLLVITLLAINFFRTHWLEHYLANKLIERTAVESDGFYQLSYKKLSISFLNGELKIEGVKLAPDSTVFNEWQQKDSLPNTYMNLSIDLIHFKGLNLTWRHNFKKLHFKSFKIKSPDIKIYQTNDLAQPDKKKRHAPTKNIYQMVSNYITDLGVGELNLDNASILFTAYTSQTPIVYAIQNVSFDAYGFLMNEESYENGKLLFCDNFKFTTNQPQQLITNNDFSLNTDSISLNTNDSTVFISNITLISNRKNPGYPENSIDASIQAVSINGIDFERQNAINALGIGSFNIVSPRIDISHILELHTNKSGGTYITRNKNIFASPLSVYDIISPIFYRFTINEIGIDNGSMKYNLYSSKGEDSFNIDKLNFKAYQLLVDSVTATQSDNEYDFLQGFELSIEDVSGAMRSNNHFIGIKQLSFNSDKGDLAINKASIKPMEVSKHKDRLTATIDEVLISGLNYKEGIEANTFIVNQPRLKYIIAEQSCKAKDKDTTAKSRKKKGTFFNPYLTHLSLNDFQIMGASIVVTDICKPKEIDYQLNDFNFYATRLLLKQSVKDTSNYSFSYGKMGFTFKSFNNYLPGNAYRVSIAEGDYSTATQKLNLEDILLMPQDTLFARSKSCIYVASPSLTISGLNYQEVKQQPELAFERLLLSTPKVALKEKSGSRYDCSLSSFSIDSLFWDKETFHLGAITLSSPRVNLFLKSNKKAVKKEKHPFEGMPHFVLPDTLYHTLAKVSDHIVLNKFALTDALANLTLEKNDTTFSYKLDTTSFALQEVSIDTKAQSFDWGKPYFSTCNITYPMDHGLFNLGIKRVELLNDSLSINGVSYTSPYSMMDFSYIDPRHKSWYDVTINQISLSGINYGMLFAENRVQLQSMDLSDITLQNFVNQKTKLPRHKWFPMIYSYLQKAPLAIDIPVVNVNNFSVIYQELSRKGSVPGKLTLDDMCGTISNLTNIPSTTHPYIIANLRGKLLGKGLFDIKWEVPVDSLNDHFVLTANMGEFDLREMNQLVTPLAPIEIKSGHLKQMTFRAEASSISAKSDMLLQYDSLYAEIANYKDGEIVEHPFVSSIANRIIQHKNENRHAITEIKRNAYHPTFNYIWQIMEPALVESVGISEKEQEKAVHVIGFFDRIRNFLFPKRRKAQLIYPELILPQEQK